MKTMRQCIPLIILWSAIAFSQNPILPAGVYMADPAAHAWDDGRLYIYASVDELSLIHI